MGEGINTHTHTYVDAGRPPERRPLVPKFVKGDLSVHGSGGDFTFLEWKYFSLIGVVDENPS